MKRGKFENTPDLILKDEYLEASVDGDKGVVPITYKPH